MENWMIIYGGIALAVCAVPAILFPSTIKRKFLILLLAISTVGLSVVATTTFSFLQYSYIHFFILPIGPIVLTILALNQHSGLHRKIGLGLAVASVLIIIYLAVSLSVTKASNAVDAMMNLSLFVKGQNTVKLSMNDPESAIFQRLYLNNYRGRQMLCGEVNGRNRMGGYAGFISFYVNLDDYMPAPFFDDGDGDTFNTYMSVCHGDDWNKVK